jgi:hydrogenase nickel incorporation protein HypA/HybF
VHELSVASAVLETALRHAEGRRVTVVTIRVGHLRQVVPDSLAFYFEMVSRETLGEGARLELETVPARLGCAGCGHEWELDLLPHFRCPACGEPDVAVISGNELEVESIEVEDEACTAPR